MRAPAHELHRFARQLFVAACAALLAGASGLAAAGPIVLAQVPLFIGGAVTPNLMLLLDDSGSMDWEILTAPHWAWSNYDLDPHRRYALAGVITPTQFNNVSQGYPKDKQVKGGIWVSSPGLCYDANDSGLCGDKIDLNGDGDVRDCEKKSCNLVTVCKPPGGGGGGGGPGGGGSITLRDDDAVPRLIATLTGSADAVAGHCPPGYVHGVMKVCTTEDLDGDGVIEDGVCEADPAISRKDYRYITHSDDNVFHRTGLEAFSLLGLFEKECFYGEGKYDRASRTAEKCRKIDTILVSSGVDVSVDDPFPIAVDWRVRSSDFNVIYYNPAIDYQPWPGLAPASFTAARSHPSPGHPGYAQTRNLEGFVYEVWIDDAKWCCGTRPGPEYKNWPGDPRGPGKKWTNYVPGSNGVVDLWDSHYRYTVYADRVERVKIQRIPKVTSFGMTTTIGPVETFLDNGTCYPELGGGTIPCRTVAQVRQNVANWYQYYRRRSFVARAALAHILDKYPTLRIGATVTSPTGQGAFWYDVPLTDGDHTAHNQAILAALYDYVWGPYGTPLRRALETVGEYFRGNRAGHPSPITHECGRNFTLLLTDGYWSGPNPSTGNVDGDPYFASTGTLADVARFYYENDLSPLPNSVPTDAWDAADWQHLQLVGIGFGVLAGLVDTDGDGWPNPPLTESDNWSPFNASCWSGLKECPQKIDDLWHAAYNSRGMYLNARSPSELDEAIAKAAAFITAQVGAAASGATSAQTLMAGTTFYKAIFDSSDWSGDLTAQPIDPTTGTLGPVSWSARTKLDATAPSARRIVTYDRAAGAGVPFQWSLLPSPLKTLLDRDPVTGTPDGLGDERLAWVRGADVPVLRDRTHKLGDIVHAAPAYVGPPRDYLPDTLEPVPYSSYQAAQAGRDPIVYVAANDGMLHAFDAATGAERWAFVPSAIIGKLPALAAPDTPTNPWKHRYLVDGTPTVADAFYGGAWHTVLVAGLGAGGQGIYALDVTDPPPAGASEASVASRVLWEFTDADDPDLGYTFSRPQVGRFPDGKWYVVFGNGYNATEPDGAASSTGHAVLYFVELATGTLARKLDVGAGTPADPNGLSTPVLVDVNGDRIVDRIYAGDLHGNLWRFDTTAPSPSGWSIAFSAPGCATVGGCTPLFRAEIGGERQPITTKPAVGPHPYGIGQGVLVYIGTGKYLEVADNSATGQTTQSIYAIWDRGTGTVDRGELVEQRILAEVTHASGAALRVTTDNPVSWFTATGSVDRRGWYLDLVDPASGANRGERIVTDPELRGERLVVATLLPEGATCGGGGSGWLMELDAATGARLPGAPWDLNGDASFTVADFALYAGSPVPPSGLKSTVGIPSRPTTVADPLSKVEYRYIVGSTAGVDIVRARLARNLGRLSWIELR